MNIIVNGSVYPIHLYVDRRLISIVKSHTIKEKISNKFRIIVDDGASYPSYTVDTLMHIGYKTSKMVVLITDNPKSYSISQTVFVEPYPVTKDTLMIMNLSWSYIVKHKSIGGLTYDPCMKVLVSNCLSAYAPWCINLLM